eukprot:scaffold1143_cov209-Skeletonema_marinoi.AAC.1
MAHTLSDRPSGPRIDCVKRNSGVPECCVRVHPAEKLLQEKREAKNKMTGSAPTASEKRDKVTEEQETTHKALQSNFIVG